MVTFLPILGGQQDNELTRLAKNKSAPAKQKGHSGTSYVILTGAKQQVNNRPLPAPNRHTRKSLHGGGLQRDAT